MTRVNNPSRNQLRETLQPKTGCLCRVVPEPVRLNHLIRWTNLRPDHAHRIFECNPLDGHVKQNANESQRERLLHSSRLEPARAAGGKVGARWVGDHHVPQTTVPDGIAQHLEHVALNVMGAIAGLDVAAPGIVPTSSKSIPHNPGNLASNEHPHSSDPERLDQLQRGMKRLGVAGD